MKNHTPKTLATLTLTGLLAATTHSQLLIGPAKLVAPLDANGQPILNLPAPTLPAHPATKTYVDTALTTTAVPLSRTLTINGITHDLTANRTWSVGDVLTSGAYANPAWITSLLWSKITATPTTLSGYGITDLIRTGNMPEVVIDSDETPTPTLLIRVNDGEVSQTLFSVHSISGTYNSLAIGANSTAVANSIAVGSGSSADSSAVAVGVSSSADPSAVAVGNSSYAYTSAVAVGNSSSADTSAVAVGNSSYADTSAVAVGNSSTADPSAVAVGANSGAGFGSTAVGPNSGAGSGSIAVGLNSNAIANNSIQLGAGTNNTANTFQVGIHRLLEATGKIPPDRYVVAAPATASSPGEPGQIAYDGSFIYVCVATNTWRRAALSAW
jgi:hypothetical protein